jgi:hypothetical protein
MNKMAETASMRRTMPIEPKFEYAHEYSQDHLPENGGCLGWSQLSTARRPKKPENPHHIQARSLAVNGLRQWS